MCVYNIMYNINILCPIFVDLENLHDGEQIFDKKTPQYLCYLFKSVAIVFSDTKVLCLSDCFAAQLFNWQIKANLIKLLT